MKKYLSLILVLFLAAASFCQEEIVNIKFIVTTPHLEDNDTVFISGNDEKLGSWRPNIVPLKKQNNSTWTLEEEFTKGKTLEYKFTLGSWGTEAVSKEGHIPDNHVIKATLNEIASHKIEAWKDEVKPAARGQITGTVEYINNLTYKYLLPRNVLVWLPPNYYKNTNEHYSVLYMHDGQNIIDPATSTLGIDWQVDEAADSLIGKNEIEAMIIVGINNTDYRVSEYSNNDTGATYMKFIVEKLKPLIDSTYRTKPEREFTATCGSSMGGLISFMLLWEYNDVFSKAICMSPAFKVRQFNYVTPVYNDVKTRDIKLYLYNGAIGLEEILQPGIHEMISVLESKGFVEGDDFVFYQDKDGIHNEAAWAKWLPAALLYIFNK
jgi:predicted alpha/beta superfamily hydrolase